MIIKLIIPYYLEQDSVLERIIRIIIGGLQTES
jgi:hypothetical protein